MFRSLLAIAAAVVLFAQPSVAGTFEDMVALDRSYIPALALTNQPNAAASARAIAALRSDWNRFRQAYAQPPAGFKPATWTTTVATIERAVTDAEARMAAGDSAGAHEALEQVREVLLVARREAGMPYFLDELTEYHTHMEAIVAAVKGKTPATLSGADVAALRTEYVKADRAWKSVVAKRSDASRHVLAPADEPAVQKLIDDESAAMAALGAALAAGDAAQVVPRASAIRPIFARLFISFGDFKRSA
jgi:hypothetical protein